MLAEYLGLYLACTRRRCGRFMQLALGMFEASVSTINRVGVLMASRRNDEVVLP